MSGFQVHYSCVESLTTLLLRNCTTRNVSMAQRGLHQSTTESHNAESFTVQTSTAPKCCPNMQYDDTTIQNWKFGSQELQVEYGIWGPTSEMPDPSRFYSSIVVRPPSSLRSLKWQILGISALLLHSRVHRCAQQCIAQQCSVHTFTWRSKFAGFSTV